MERLPLARLLAGLPLAAGGCLVTSSLDELEGEPVSCDAGRVDCDGDPGNGCETDLESDPLSCGVCGTACPSAPSAAPACVSGSCTIACDLFTANCDGIDKNGCETATEKDTDNCGQCGHECGTTNTTSSACEDGACAIECTAGYASCDGSDASGCEASLDSDAHCGMCSRSCPATECSTGSCAVSPLLDFATAISVAKGHVYVAVSESNCTSTTCTYIRKLRRVPISGGTVEDLFDLTSAVTEIEASPAGVLYLASSAGLFQYTPDSGQTTPTQLSSLRAEAIELDATHAYFLSNDGIQRISLSGGAVDLVVDLDSKPGGNWEATFALGGGTFYFAAKSDDGEGLHSVPIAGGTATLVHEGDIELVEAQADADGVYFTLSNDSTTLYRALGGEVTALVTGQSSPEPIVIEGTMLFWWNSGTGALMTAALDGTGVQSLLQQPAPSGALLAVDAEAIYWLNAAGQLNRLLR